MRDYIDDMIRALKKIYSIPWYWNLENLDRMRQIEKQFPGSTQLLNLNKEFKSIHKGKRCFVLGNGPSLNDIDFSLLEDEIVFTVNRLTLHPNFDKLRSNYHFALDGDTFGIPGIYGKRCQPGFKKYALQQLRTLHDKGNPILFVPIQAKDIIKKSNLNNKLRVRYLAVEKRSFIDYGYKSNDITRPIPWFKNVVLFAIWCATYMGFSEIYLLGCEQTMLRDVINAALGNTIINDHAYNGEEKINEEGYRQFVKERGMLYYIEGDFHAQKAYIDLYKWCRSKRIKLYNLSSVTLIDGIPKKDLKNIL